MNNEKDDGLNAARGIRNGCGLSLAIIAVIVITCLLIF